LVRGITTSAGCHSDDLDVIRRHGGRTIRLNLIQFFFCKEEIGQIFKVVSRALAEFGYWRIVKPHYSFSPPLFSALLS
jgi:hypothetical protein